MVRGFPLALASAALLAALPGDARRACQRGPAPADPSLFAAPSAKLGAASDSVEKVKGLIVLADFSDAPASIPKADIEAMANQAGYSGYSNKGSLRDYFLAVSNGKFDYSLVVWGYVRVPRTKASYDAENGGEDAFVKDVLKGADDQGLDFTAMSNKSGALRSVNILYAGAWGEEALWPHQGSISGIRHDNMSVTRYQVTGLENSPSIGPILHESGHLLFDWPDLYDTDENSAGAGRYCLMSNEDFKNPCPPNPWLRHKQGWVTATEITKNMPGQVLKAASNGRTVFRFVNPARAGEAFFIEAVQKTGRWVTWPDQGLAIWHVDERGDNNRPQMTATSHYQAGVEQADGLYDLEKDRNQGGSGDLFKAGGKVAFGEATVPDSKWWSGTASGLDIVDVSPVQDTMTFKLKGIATSLLAHTPKASVVRGPKARGQVLWKGLAGPSVRTDGRAAKP